MEQLFHARKTTLLGALPQLGEDGNFAVVETRIGFYLNGVEALLPSA